MFSHYNIQLIYYKKNSGEFYGGETFISYKSDREKAWKELEKLKDKNCLPGLVGKSDGFIVLAVSLGDSYKDSRIIL